MTATDELCRLLEERGEQYIRHSDGMVTWRYYSDPHSAVEALDGTLQVTGLTPEQAIAATLGAGTCCMEERHGGWYCTGCGEMVGTCDASSELFIDGNAVSIWNYCPICGARVVSE